MRCYLQLLRARRDPATHEAGCHSFALTSEACHGLLLHALHRRQDRLATAIPSHAAHHECVLNAWRYERRALPHSHASCCPPPRSSAGRLDNRPLGCTTGRFECRRKAAVRCNSSHSIRVRLRVRPPCVATPPIYIPRQSEAFRVVAVECGDYASTRRCWPGGSAKRL